MFHDAHRHRVFPSPLLISLTEESNGLHGCQQSPSNVISNLRVDRFRRNGYQLPGQHPPGSESVAVLIGSGEGYTYNFATTAKL